MNVGLKLFCKCMPNSLIRWTLLIHACLMLMSWWVGKLFCPKGTTCALEKLTTSPEIVWNCLSIVTVMCLVFVHFEEYCEGHKSQMEERNSESWIIDTISMPCSGYFCHINTPWSIKCFKFVSIVLQDQQKITVKCWIIRTIAETCNGHTEAELSGNVRVILGTFQVMVW